MKNLLIAILACGFVFAANAQPAVVEDVDQGKAETAVVAQDEGEARADMAVADAQKAVNDRNCLRHTGSRLIGKDRRQSCANVPGRVYTREDIERTGHTDLLSALRTLDPSVR